MKSTWMRLIAFILNDNEYDYRRVKTGNDFFSFKEKAVKGYSTYNIHWKVRGYLKKSPNISTTGKVLHRMESYGLVKKRRLNIGRTTSYNPMWRFAKFWRGNENFWFLTPAGKRYYEKTKNETRNWLVERGFIRI